MNYNLADKTELKACRNRISYLTRKGKRVRVAQVAEGRSLAQNSYLHLLIAAYAIAAGYKLHEAKTVYKRYANPSIYIYEKNGAKFLKSSADLTKDEMRISIDAFIQWAAENGIELPLATDQGWLLSIENDIERNRRYL